MAVAAGAVLFSACKKTFPDAPEIVAGPSSGIVNVSYSFTAIATAPEDGLWAIQFDWGDGDTSGWSGFVPSGDSVMVSHAWTSAGAFSVKARARGEHGTRSEWSAAQTLTLTFAWIRTFGGSDVELGRSAQQTADGGYVVVGYTGSYGAGATDVYLVKTDASGDTVWTRTIGGANHEEGWSVQQTTDGGYIVGGHVDAAGGTANDVYLVKTDSAGGVSWTRTYGSTGNDLCNAVRQTADGGYVAVGCSDGLNDPDVRLIKTDADGYVLWAKRYGDSLHDRGKDVQQTADGGYVIVGYSWSPFLGWHHAYLVKTDGSGNLTWSRHYGGDQLDEGWSVQQTSDGGYIIAGCTGSYGTGHSDVWLIKTDASGDTLRTRTYGGDCTDRGLSVQQTSDGGYVIAGSKWTLGTVADVYLVKTNGEGDTVWTRTFGGPYVDEALSVRQTSDGGYIVAGYTWPYGSDERDVYLIKTDAMGNVGP
jgi:hypothetical protein